MDLSRLLLLDPLAAEGGGAPPESAPPPDAGSGGEPAVGPSADRPEFLDGSEAAEAPAASGVASAAPADPNLAPAAPRSIRDAARDYGLDLSQHADDHAAFVALVQAAQAARQDDYYTQLGRQLAPHYRGVQEYLRAQAAQAQQAQAPEAPPAWQPPPFDERWLNLVDRDEATGLWRAKPGVNPEYAEAVQAYADWMGRFQRDPMGMIAPMVEARAQEIARQVVQEQYQGYQVQATVSSIVEQNAPWIYQVDAHGRRLVGADGRYVPTPLGARYIAHLQSLRAAGVTDPRAQDHLARSLLQGELAVAQAQAGGAGAQARHARGRPDVNPGQAVEPGRRGSVPGATAPATGGRSLAEVLREQFAAEGITDADFQQIA
jgi:hypothetical protein